MRTIRATVVPMLACLLFAGPLAANDAPSEETGLTREEAVSLVLATDSRYADLPDFHRLEIERAANFDMGIILGSDYYRVLPTLPTELSGLGFIDFHYAGNWLIEVTLVRDCVDLYGSDGQSSEMPPLPDPCSWRHSWFYRVGPDGTVSILFDEGDTTPTPD